MADDGQTRKLAIIVALDVAGYSARTEADEARTTAEVAALRKVIEGIAAKHGGRVFNTAGDGFMLEFGSSLAGVEAAFELAKTCEPKVRVGVHLGDVAVQPNGDLLGHGVNVAARLMARSDPGSALVSGAVRYTIRGPIVERLISRGIFQLDKMAEAIEAFALIAAAPAEPPPVPVPTTAAKAAAPQLPTMPEAAPLPPYVGRVRELERVRDRIDKAKRGEGGFLLFSGEAGVGKTRLTQEAERLARAGGFMVTRGHCHDMDSAPPYQPLLEQIEQARRMLGSDIMRRSMGENATELSKLMPELRHQYSDIPPYPSLPPEQERRYLLHGVAEFLARSATFNPLLIVFEDLHWADESTCILLRHLAERLKNEPVLLMGTYRDGELETGGPFARALQKLNRERLSDEIKLGRLSQREVVELLVKRFDQQPPKSLIDLLFYETEGNPFFIEEVIGLLQDSDKLFAPDGTFRTDVEISDTEVAQGVKLIIEDRVSKASPLCREILTLAAVTGRMFPFELLVKAEGKHSEDEILTAIEEAEEKRMIEDVSQGRIARYQFVHEQIRQTLLSGLSRPRRQRLHLRIADALETVYANASEKYAGEIGHHLYQAGAAADHVRTARFLTVAGERAIDALAFEDALRQFDLAIGVLEESDDALTRARLQGLRAMALHGAEKIPESLAALKLAIQTAPNQAAKDEFTLQRCNMLLELWRGSETLDDLEGLSVRARQSGDPQRDLRVQQALARAYYVMSLDRKGFAEKSKEAYERAIDVARTQGAHKILGSCLVATATLTDYWLDYRAQAQANLDEADRIARETGDEGLAVDVATARLSFNFPGEQIVDDETVLQRALALRDPVRLNALYFRMMWSTFSTARLERCVEICDAGIELAYRIGTLPVQYPTIKALALMDLGRFGEAWDALGKEIADDAHRFGAALRDYGKLYYELHVADIEGAMARAPHVIDESKALARAWMLKSLSSRLALAAPSHAGDPATIARIEALIADTGMSPGSLGTAALTLAKGDAKTARETLGPTDTADVAQFAIAARSARMVLLANTEAALGNDRAASDHIAAAVKLARERSMRSQLWRLLGEQAHFAEASGNAQAASDARAEAKQILGEIAQTVPDERQRANLLQDGEAKRLGLT